MEHIDLIAARMEEARFERGIPVAELARRIGVDRKRLWRVLNGERAMRADEFVRLCAALGLGLGGFLPPNPALFPGEPPAPFPPQVPRALSDFERVVHDEVAEDVPAELAPPEDTCDIPGGSVREDHLSDGPLSDGRVRKVS
ncbi:helix-turn-helix transcriptional regulator [Gordonibacter urolithinfaciens]|uniref:helix-turn-helix transcriptional regulator n=1 Tax=Eggerthellaceae TaxID=1643826 RepID=UPI003AAB5C73